MATPENLASLMKGMAGSPSRGGISWQSSIVLFPSGEPGVSGDFWGSQEGCQ